MGLAANTEKAEKLQSELKGWQAIVSKRHNEFLKSLGYTESVFGNDNHKKAPKNAEAA